MLAELEDVELEFPKTFLPLPTSHPTPSPQLLIPQGLGPRGSHIRL